MVLLAPVASDDLVLESVDDNMELLPLSRQLGFNLPETLQGLHQFLIGQLGELGEDAIVHDLVDETPAGGGRQRGHHIDVAKVGLGPEHHPGRKDLGKSIEKRPFFFTAAAPELEIQQVHTPMQQTPVVRNLGLYVLRCVPPRPELVEVEGIEADDELRPEDSIDSAKSAHV